VGADVVRTGTAIVPAVAAGLGRAPRKGDGRRSFGCCDRAWWPEYSAVEDERYPEGYVSTLTSPLTDNPVGRINDDLFGFRPYIEELHAAVARAEPLPITVGVFGPWGSGKSSFLRMWHDLLAFAPENKKVLFNPWKYDQKVEVWAALIQSLLAELQAEETTREKAGRLARAATWLGLKTAVAAAAAVSTGGAVSADKVDDAITAITTSNAEYYRGLNRFEEDFRDLVGEYVGERGRLFVFVDDLDRCTPESAVSVLEALKLFVGDARCVFVLAMDFDLLAEVAAARFGEGVAVSGAEYLEKIIQLPFFLPDIAFPALRESVASHVGELASNEAFWELVRIGFGNNPRKVKRYVNVLNLATAILHREGDGRGSLSVVRRLQLAELLIIRGEHRDLFRHLLAYPGDWARLEESPALPPADARPGTPAAIEHEPDPVLVRFLLNPALTRLLSTRPGSYHDHPPAPAAAEVERMLRTIRLTSRVAAVETTAEPTPATDAPYDETPTWEGS
jgi:hypothetical protein